MIFHSTLIATLASVTLANPIKGWVNTPSQTDIPAPLDDPWYHTAPPNLESYEKGDVIEMRDVGIGHFQRVNYAKQLKYRSENSRGEPIYSITTVIIPENAQLDKLVSYQAYEDAAYLNCAPSYQLTAQNFDTAIWMAYPDIQPVLDNGWVLNLPDHEGMNNSFLGGPLAGKLVLDSLRAVRKSKDQFGLKDNYEQVLWGYSGGSHASGHAAEMQPTYAPEEKLKFLVLGGIIANSRGTADRINGGPLAGFLASSIVGLASEFTELWDLFHKHMNPETFPSLVAVTKMCMVDVLLNFTFQNIWERYFDGNSITHEPLTNQLLELTSLGHTVPQCPMYLYHSELDEVQPIHFVDELADFYCAGGAHFEYARIPLNGHMTTLTDWGQTVVTKIDEAFRNNMPSGCIRH